MSDRFKCHMSGASVRLDGNDQLRRDLLLARVVVRSNGNVLKHQHDRGVFARGPKRRRFGLFYRLVRLLMAHLPKSASDDELIRFVDRWAALMEKEDYSAAFAFTAHVAEMGWTADLMREVVKAYGKAEPTQRVTVFGRPTDVRQRKEVSRWKRNQHGEIAEIWYDLNIDGFVSDLTATFRVVEVADGLMIKLNDIHVM